jgi:hypothetical protein
MFRRIKKKITKTNNLKEDNEKQKFSYHDKEKIKKKKHESTMLYILVYIKYIKQSID